MEFSENSQGGWVPRIQSLTGGTFEGLVLEGQLELTGTAETVFWKQGYQSWSWSGVLSPTPAQLDERGVAIAKGDGDSSTVFFEQDSVSWWLGLLGKHQGGKLFVGALSSNKTRFYMATVENGLQLVWGNRGEQIAMTQDETMELDSFVATTGDDAWRLHRQYAQNVAQEIPFRSASTLPPLGWATWYQYYAEVTEDDIATNFAAIEGFQQNEKLMPIEIFQIDDGWQNLWGDWQAGPEFPTGMPALADEINERGMEPGLWMAPFYVSTETETYQNNPDWWVREATTGEPIIFTNLGTGSYAIIDTSHPDALDWLGEQISAKVGCDLFVLYVCISHAKTI